MALPASGIGWAGVADGARSDGGGTAGLLRCNAIASAAITATTKTALTATQYFERTFTMFPGIGGNGIALSTGV
jgi:hypothetical protein